MNSGVVNQQGRAKDRQGRQLESWQPASTKCSFSSCGKIAGESLSPNSHLHTKSLLMASLKLRCALQVTGAELPMRSMTPKSTGLLQHTAGALCLSPEARRSGALVHQCGKVSKVNKVTHMKAWIGVSMGLEEREVLEYWKMPRSGNADSIDPAHSLPLVLLLVDTHNNDMCL